MDSGTGPVRRGPEDQTGTQWTGLRRLLPAVADARSIAKAARTSYEPVAKPPRSQVPAACLECRKKKVKCSGLRPKCYRCSQTNIECIWDTEPDTTRIVSIRKRKEELERENEDLHELLRFLYLRPDEEAREIFRRLRVSGNALEVLNAVRTADLLLQRRQVGEGADQITSFFLLDATFFLAFVEQEAFLEDMRSCSPETARYCSPVLVNAICALRSHSSKRAKEFGLQIGRDMQSLFFDEAQRHLYLEAGRTSLATAQALLLMHLSSAAMGADRASRMHQLCAGDMFNNLLAVEVDVTVEIRDRKIMSKVLWGMYCFESMFAFAYLRPSLLPKPPIQQETLDETSENELESADNGHRDVRLRTATCDLSVIFNNAMEYNGNLRLWRESVSRKIRLDEDYSSSASCLRSEPLPVVV
ncbi:Nitrogen assimilation transcription factor nit-4 [Colletotrichum viniferum]|nr:Nitrogen assimilation transcription factor nit-4 [Colletotrichum viniferum]